MEVAGSDGRGARRGADPLSLPNPLLLPNTLCDYYGKGLVPKRYQDSKDGQLSFEPEPWLRYR